MGRMWLILPDLFPSTVVSFFWKEDERAPGRSWRIRDYASGTREEYGPTHIDLTHAQILDRARWTSDAPPVAIDDPWWAAETQRLNEVHAAALAKEAKAIPSRGGGSAVLIPILDEPVLRRLRGGKALERMLKSPNSEDWVSWTVFRTLERQLDWWPHLLQVADLPDVDPRAVPSIHLWRSLASPVAYEQASRARMAASSEPALRARAQEPMPVEGDTEVDIAIEGPDVLWFLEAKLHSDLSANTTRDPTRNQLARNIDVLLEQAGGRRALMSLVVLDRRPDRLHTQLVARYRSDPGALHAALPHRAPAQIDAVLRDLRVILWSDLLPLLGQFEPSDVREELWRRCVGERGPIFDVDVIDIK